MPIKGIAWVSLVDFPGRVCTTLFYEGCNMRCGFCHNTALVQKSPDLDVVDDGEVIAQLKRRQNLVSAVCITGGEPTLDPELPTMMKRLKAAGFLTKLDTNGTRPQVLGDLLSAGLVDYVAMDIKGPQSKYDLIAGTAVDYQLIKQSISLIKSAAPAYEFRTTVVPGLLRESDLVTLCRELGTVEKYVLQQFRATAPLVNPKYERIRPYSPSYLYEIAAKLKDYASKIEVRC